MDGWNQKRHFRKIQSKEMIKFNFSKHLPTINFLLMVSVLVFVVLNNCETKPVGMTELEKQRLEHIDSAIDVLTNREPIENKIMIIDNETLKKINSNDSIRDPHVIDSLFARFGQRVNEFKQH